MSSQDGFPYTNKQRNWWFATHRSETEPGPRTHYMEWAPMRFKKSWGVHDPEGNLVAKFDNPDHAHAFLQKQLSRAASVTTTSTTTYRTDRLDRQDARDARDARDIEGVMRAMTAADAAVAAKRDALLRMMGLKVGK